MNKIFNEHGKELKTAKDLANAFHNAYSVAQKNITNEDYDVKRVEGAMCNCNGNGVFDLLPLDDEAVVEGGKRYMVCRKCGYYSHL